MSVRFMTTNLWDSASALTASSAATGYPAANTQHRLKLKVWRATGDTAEWLKVNLGSAKEIRALVLAYANLTTGATLTLQGHTSDSWTAPAYSQVIAISAAMAARGQIVYHLGTPRTYQWWRITIADSANPDGYVRIGRVFLGTYAQPARSYYKEWSLTVVDPSEVMVNKTGQKFVNVRPSYHEIKLDFRSVPAADRTIFKAIADEVGQAYPFWITLDSGDLAGSTYYVSAASPWEIVHIFMSQLYRMPLELEEER